jgi:hypothetical protein
MDRSKKKEVRSESQQCWGIRRSVIGDRESEVRRALGACATPQGNKYKIDRCPTDFHGGPVRDFLARSEFILLRLTQRLLHHYCYRVNLRSRFAISKNDVGRDHSLGANLGPQVCPFILGELKH